MALLNELVRTVRETHALTLERTAEAADLAIVTVSRYEQGEREVSFRYVRALFALTGDRRLLRYFSPAVAEAIFSAVVDAAAESHRDTARGQAAERQTPPAGDPKDLLGRELDALLRLTKAAQYCEKIVADGRIDESDTQAVLNLQRLHEEVRSIMDAGDRAMTAWLDSRPAA